MAIRGASQWIVSPGRGLFHWHNHRSAHRRVALAQRGAKAESVASSSRRQMDRRARNAGATLKGALDLTWQEITEKGRPQCMSQRHKFEHKLQEEEKGRVAYPVWMVRMLRQATVIKRKKRFSLCLSLLSQYYEVAQSLKSCQNG